MIRKTHKTKRLIIRPLNLSDYTEWYDSLVNCLPKQSKWDRGPLDKKLCTKRCFNKAMKHHELLAKKDDYYRYYAFDKKSGKIVGHIDFDIFIRSHHQFANFGYQIYNRYWNKGYGKEASLKGLQIGFKDLKLNRLEAAINLDNKKSIKVARSISMRYEGLKKRYWFENGKWTDHLIYVANPEDIGLKASKPEY